MPLRFKPTKLSNPPFMLSGNSHFPIYSCEDYRKCKQKMIMHTPQLNAFAGNAAGVAHPLPCAEAVTRRTDLIGEFRFHSL